MSQYESIAINQNPFFFFSVSQHYYFYIPGYCLCIFPAIQQCLKFSRKGIFSRKPSAAFFLPVPMPLLLHAYHLPDRDKNRLFLFRNNCQPCLFSWYTDFAAGYTQYL